MNPVQPRVPYQIAVLGIVLLVGTIAAARTFSRIFEAPADKVYAAALRAAETDGRVTIMDENTKQRRLHLRVNADSVAMSEPPLGQPPSGPPITADASSSQQWGGVLLTLIVMPNAAMQSTVTIETYSPGPGLATGRNPTQFPGDRRRADEFQERRAACMMLVRMRSILRLPSRRLGGAVSLDSCE